MRARKPDAIINPEKRNGFSGEPQAGKYFPEQVAMKIVILGAGVAGVSSAIALTQKGFDVTVYERHASPSNIGAGIVVWPNAAFVLQQLGVLEAIEAVSGRPMAMRRQSSGGEDLGAIDIQKISALMGQPSLSILRRDFQNILTSRLESLGVSICYDHTVARIATKRRGQAVVTFKNGSTVTADVLIGADGRMASCARQFVHGNNAPVYQGFINWIGVYESSDDSFDEIAVADYWGIGERFGIVPVTKRKAYWAAGIASETIGGRNPAVYKEELASIFADWPQPVKLMIERTPTAQINKIYVHDHDPVELWHRDNLIMIGDAAHAPLPTSGQGACQALEDAWHLAACLSRYPADLPTAFLEFTRVRLEKTTGIIRAGRSLAASLFNRDEKYCAVRNENSKQTDYGMVAAAMARGWAQHLPITGS